MLINIFGKKGCPSCTEAMDYLDEREVLFNYYDVEVSVENYIMMLGFLGPYDKNLPVITINGEYIGGSTDLRKYVP